MLPQIIQQIATANPALMEAIRDNQEEFVAMMNAQPGEGNVGGAPVNPNAGNVGGGPVRIEITEADRNAIDRLKGVSAYSTCNYTFRWASPNSW